MSRRIFYSVLAASALITASVAGATSAAALASGAEGPASVEFGNVAVYGSTQQDVTITATGGSVTFGGGVPTIAVVGGATDQADDFSVVSENCSGDTLAVGGTCTVTVQFQPFASGLRQAALSVVTTSPSATLLVPLNGTGVPNATGTYYALATPARFYDSGSVTPLAPFSTTTVPITSRAGIPAAGVSAVVVNLTADATTATGYLTAFPSDVSRPAASSINFPKGWTGANMVTVPVGADGKIKIYNHSGTTRAIVDVLGWYAKDDSVRVAPVNAGMGAQFLSTSTGDPVRIYDSRLDVNAGKLPFYPGDRVEFNDTWLTSAAASAVKAYAVTITAVAPTSSGYLKAWDGADATEPSASTVNYQKNVVAPNMAIVPAAHLSATETGFGIRNYRGTTHVVVDVTGYYVADDSAGMRFQPLTAPSPKRILDTRATPTIGLHGAFTAGQTRTAPASSVASQDSIYVVGNTTGVQPTLATYLTLWSGVNARPGTSNLNVNPKLIRSVSTYAPLAYHSGAAEPLTYNIFNHAGSINVLFDAAGTLDIYPGSALAPAGAATSGTSGLSATSGTDLRTADLTLAGRTIPGSGSFASGLEGTTHRRG